LRIVGSASVSHQRSDAGRGKPPRDRARAEKSARKEVIFDHVVIFVDTGSGMILKHDELSH